MSIGSEREVVIVGGGIAGASIAYFLARLGIRDVLLVEREPIPAYHASGRSAAALVELEPDPVQHRLLADAARFLREPPDDFTDGPLLDTTGVVLLLDEPEWSELTAAAPAMAAAGTRFALLAPADAAPLLPVPCALDVAGVAHLPDAGRIDVPRLLHGYLRAAETHGVELRYGATVTAVDVAGDRVTGVHLGDEHVPVRRVVNAAGAWAGRLGALAGATPIPLSAYRRTIVTFPAPAGVDARRWPLVAYESRHLYFAPEAGGMLASPMDEHLSEPCDARPDDATVEHTLRRVAEVAASLGGARPTGARAGLRTFAPDRRFVIGEDPRRAGFYWLAGHGGWGIETSPAAGRIAAELVATGHTTWPDAAALSPARFAG